MDYNVLPKRKRSQLEDEAQHDQTFTLQNLTTGTALCFEPRSKLLRAHLPLSWFASVSSSSALTPASILQGEIRAISGWEYSILVVRLVPNGGLYALEKFDDDCYVSQPLQPFVSEQWVKDASIGAAPQVSMQMMLHYVQEPIHTTTENARRTPSMTLDNAAKAPRNRRGAAARMSILSQSASRPHSPISPQVLDFSDAITTEPGKPDSLDLPQIEGQAETQQKTEISMPIEQAATAEEARSDPLSPTYLRQRYLEHLYKSKTSLAYYAKGPMSRARARARAQDASMPTAQLASFYRESILSAKKMDLKYKESMKETISKTAPKEEAIDEVTAKRKASKKTKLCKNGLWPTEPEFISEWWRSRTSKTTPTLQQRDVEIRDAVACLRMREAQMQIILILETLALEAKDNERNRQSLPDSVEAKAESVEQDIKVAQPEKKSKPRDLAADLEVLADKLCIWHSVGLESTFAPSDTTKKDAHSEEQSDQLRNFCTDVIIAFYNPKLPLICRSLCKTLAGPDLYDQSQKASRIKQEGSQHPSPASLIQRRAPSASGGVLERVLSTEGLRPPSPPALVRSSTLPPASHLQREPSELANRPVGRNSRHASISFTNREIDLAADAQVTASKRRKLEMVAYARKETEAAIQALKKPNRTGAGKAYMDEIERRKLVGSIQSIQITATPRVNRKKAILESDDELDLPLLDPEDMAVPASNVKPRGISSGLSIPRSSAKKRAVLAAIYDTPSRGSAKKTNTLPVTSNYSARAIKSNELADELVFATPQKPKPAEVLSTPVKQRSASSRNKENKFEVTEIAFKAMQRVMGEDAIAQEEKESIYDSLGWNDDYDA